MKLEKVAIAPINLRQRLLESLDRRRDRKHAQKGRGGRARSGLKIEPAWSIRTMIDAALSRVVGRACRGRSGRTRHLLPAARCPRLERDRIRVKQPDRPVPRTFSRIYLRSAMATKLPSNHRRWMFISVGRLHATQFRPSRSRPWCRFENPTVHQPGAERDHAGEPQGSRHKAGQMRCRRARYTRIQAPGRNGVNGAELFHDQSQPVRPRFSATCDKRDPPRLHLKSATFAML